MPQVMVMPGRSGAGGDGSDPHQRQYENKDFDEADGQDAESSDEDATDGSQEQGTGDGSDGGQCGCQGPDGQHRCEAVAVEGDRCELCLLGCAPGEGTQSAEHYRKCTCATEECTGCICGCECVGCINRKRLHATANRDTLQGEHWQHADRYAGEDRYSRHPGSHVGSINAGGGSDRLYLDEEVSGRRRWDGTPECVNSWAELHFWMERCKWRSWALMGLEIAHMLPADGVTAFESEMWERMDTDPDKYEVPLRELVHVAVDHMEQVSSRGIMGKQTLEIRLTRHLMAVMTDQQTTALTWVRVTDEMWTAARGAVRGALELRDDGELQMGGEGWRIIEDASGRLNGMVLQRKRTMAFIKRNDLMTVIMTTLAVGLKAGLMRTLDNWWLKTADSRDLVGLLLRVQCIQGLMTEGMKRWMMIETRGCWETMGVTMDENAMITRAIEVGQRSRKLKSVGLWRIHIAEEASIDSWWLQLQGNSEGSQRGLKQWLLNMLGH